eukprot:s657_g7.t1
MVRWSRFCHWIEAFLRFFACVCWSESLPSVMLAKCTVHSSPTILHPLKGCGEAVRSFESGGSVGLSPDPVGLSWISDIFGEPPCMIPSDDPDQSLPLLLEQVTASLTGNFADNSSMFMV